jgi:hypothetical protein
MTDESRDVEDLALTQAEAAPPPAGPALPPGETQFDPQLYLEVQKLAERAGGLEKLREVVDTLLSRGG